MIMLGNSSQMGKNGCLPVPPLFYHHLMFTGKQPEEIRKTFNIKNDFTPEEEEQVCCVSCLYGICTLYMTKLCVVGHVHLKITKNVSSATCHASQCHQMGVLVVAFPCVSPLCKRHVAYDMGDILGVLDSPLDVLIVLWVLLVHKLCTCRLSEWTWKLLT